QQVDRFMGPVYDTATTILVNDDAYVDKFVGDEVIGVFVPAMATEFHARQAVESGQQLLHETGHADPDGPWIPVGVGLNTGVAYVGSVGTGEDTELTALGDEVNITA